MKDTERSDSDVRTPGVMMIAHNTWSGREAGPAKKHAIKDVIGTMWVSY